MAAARNVFKTPLVLFILIFAAACSPEKKHPWYETVSMYHVLVKSFYDSDGDGKGDLKGLTQKLDYIKSLNVNTIHPLPLTPALNVPEMPRSQYGYEITDFKNIHPDYGTMDDFKTLIKEAHKRGLHVVLDFITTVISVRHPFFQDILTNPDSKYKSWIITADEIPAGEWMNFNDYAERFKSSAWKPLPFGGYYYSLWGNSPFLDYHNPAVRDYILSVVDFWLDAGADGFRIDATKHLYINGAGESKQYHQPENFEFWKALRRHITEKYGTDKVLIAETIPVPNNIAYVTPNREMFDLMFDSTFINDIYPYRKTDADLLYSAPYLHSFFGNPDVFKLTPLKNRLVYHSDHDGARLATRLAEPTPDRLKIAASILLLTPAHVKLYAGDETGIKGFSDFKDFKNKWFHATVATMAWDGSKNGGFSTSDAPVVPVTDDYAAVNVKSQDKDETSLLNHYRGLLKLKNSRPDLFFKGERAALNAGNDKVYAYLLNGGNATAMALINLSGKPEQFSIDLSAFRPDKMKKLFGRGQIDIRTDDGVVRGTVPPRETFVYEFKKFDRTAFPKKRDALDEKAVRVAADETTVSDPAAIYVLNSPASGAVLRLFKGQGKAGLTAYSVYGANKLSETFDGVLDTTDGDVTIPVLAGVTDAVAFSTSGLRFRVENAPPASAVPENLTLLAENGKNKNLRALYTGKDGNFRYFKIERSAENALPLNGGVDFILFVSALDRPRVQHKTTFWHLPEVVSRRPVDGMILYERHIKYGRVQTDINAMRNFGVAAVGKSFIFETPDAFYVMIADGVLPRGKIAVAPFVWSAGGRWGERPPETFPVVERLPDDGTKTRKPDLIEDYLELP